MANINKYNELWKLFEKYNFNIDMNLYKDLLCVICGKLLQNSTQNLCGCRYCYLCISTYLNGKKKCCPRKIDDCNHYIINSTNDLQIDHAANKKISLIEVKCPELFCNMKIELRNLVEHVKSHQMKCPYRDVGCGEKLNHRNNENHTKLIVDAIKHLKNEVDTLKERLIEKEEIIEDLKLSNINLREEIVKLKKIEMESVKDKLKILEENSQYKQNLINEMMEEHVKKRNNERNFKEQRISLYDPNMGTIRKSKFITDKAYSHQSQIKYAPFTWTIENFLDKRENARNGIEKCIFSEIFFSHFNGYSLKLCFYPNGFGVAENSHITVLFTIVQSKLDDTLEWPMKREITIALTDHVSGAFHASEKYNYDSVGKHKKYVFHKPCTDYTNENCYYGTPKFAKVNSFIKNNRLLKDGGILLQCSVN